MKATRYARPAARGVALGALLVALGATAAAGTAHRQRSTISGNLTIWCWGAARDSLKVVDDGFSRKYPDIQVNYVTLNPSDLYQKVQLATAAGSGFPDVSCVEDSHLYQFVKLGVLADITSRVKPYVPKILDYKWQGAQQAGRYYAMPWDAGPVALFYRRSIFKQAHVNPRSLQTWDAYYKAGLKIKKLGVAMWIQSKAPNDARFFETLLWQQGAGYVDAKGNVVIDKDKRALKALHLIGQMWSAGILADQKEGTEPWY